MKHHTLKTLFFCLMLGIFVSSCSIFNPDIEIEKRVSLYFNVDGVAEDLSAAEDTLRINEFKFSIRQFNLSGDDIELGSSNNVKAFIFGYNESTENDRLVISVGLSISDNATFDSYKMFLSPVAKNASILDTDFIGNDGNYSIIIKGSLNQKNFTYRSKASFDREMSFDNVKLDNVSETIVLIKSINLDDVFFDGNGDLIDPTNSENSSVIVSNIRNALEIEAYSSDIY